MLDNYVKRKSIKIINIFERADNFFVLEKHTTVQFLYELQEGVLSEMKENQLLRKCSGGKCHPQNMSSGLKQEDPYFYAEYLLANFCMPTMLGLKPASLIRVDKITEKQNDRLLSAMKIQLKQFNCQYFILYENRDMLNLLIYKEELLLRTIYEKENELFFLSYGYDLQGDRIKRILADLNRKFILYYDRMNVLIGFPHEVGILLGYPLPDVEDFIKNNGKNYILCGCWKVYHNAEEAKAIFDRYKKMQKYAVETIRKGKNLRDMLGYCITDN